MKVNWIDLMAGISPEFLSAMASFVLPGTATLLREPFPCLMRFDWNSEGWCMGVFALAAYGLGKLAGKVSSPEGGEDPQEGPRKIPDMHAHLIAGIAGLGVGLVPVLMFSSCI